jgi:hypothetical protein
MLRTLYTGLAADLSTDAVQFDPTVRNPARIWRLYGSHNRKGTPTLDRPHRIALASIPAPWRAVSLQDVARLAAAYAKRRPEAPPPRPAQSIEGSGDFRTLDVVGWFRAHGIYRRALGSGKHSVACPWTGEHSSEPGPLDTSTVAWEAEPGLWPTFHCSHAHCSGRGIRDVMALWGDASSHCAAAWGGKQ